MKSICKIISSIFYTNNEKVPFLQKLLKNAGKSVSAIRNLVRKAHKMLQEAAKILERLEFFVKKMLRR